MYLEDNLIPYINLSVILILIVCVLFGLKNGFLKQFLNLLSFIVVMIISWLYAPVLAQHFIIYRVSIQSIMNTNLQNIVNYRLNTVIWFLIIFIVGSLLMLIVKVFINRVGDITILKYFNRFLGAILGLVKGGLIIFLITLLLANAFFLNGTEFKQKTYLLYFDEIVGEVFEFAKDAFNDSEVIQYFIAHPDQITQEQRKIVADWLKQNNYSNEDIESIFHSILIN